MMDRLGVILPVVAFLGSCFSIVVLFEVATRA